MNPAGKQRLEPHPPLTFDSDSRRRWGIRFLVTGAGLLVALAVAVYVAIANWWYAAEGTETFDYWFDIVVVAALALGVSSVFAGSVLLGLSMAGRRK